MEVCGQLHTPWMDAVDSLFLMEIQWLESVQVQRSGQLIMAKVQLLTILYLKIWLSYITVLRFSLCLMEVRELV
jgi:hypothetical protein